MKFRHDYDLDQWTGILRAKNDAEDLNRDIEEAMGRLEPMGKGRKDSYEVKTLKEDLETAIKDCRQRGRERDQHFDNFREACRVGKQHRDERDALLDKVDDLMRENDALRFDNTDLKRRLDGLFKALSQRPIEFLGGEQVGGPVSTDKDNGKLGVYGYLTIAAGLVASLPVAQAIYVATKGWGVF